MSSLRDLLSRIRPGDDFDDVATRIKRIIENYNRPGIHKQFRQDVIQMIGSVLDLAESMSEKNYRIDEVFNDIAEIQQYMSLMLRHGLLARPRAVGFALLNTASGAIVPGFYASQQEADKQLNFLNTLNLTIPLIVVPAECVTSNILQPEEEQKGTPTLIPPPVSASSPTVNALKPNPPPASPFSTPNPGTPT